MKKLSSILLGASLIFSVNSFGADISEKKNISSYSFKY